SDDSNRVVSEPIGLTSRRVCRARAECPLLVFPPSAMEVCSTSPKGEQEPSLDNPRIRSSNGSQTEKLSESGESSSNSSSCQTPTPVSSLDNANSKNGSHSTEDHLNGNQTSSDEAPISDIDAVLQEESKRLDKVMSPSKKSSEEDKIKTMDKDVQYKRLIELLTKSEFYTKFLVNKLEEDNLKKKKGKGSSPLKGRKPATAGQQQVLAIAADIISKKSNDEIAPEESVVQDPSVGQTKTLANGLEVPLSQPKLLTGACLRDYQLEGLNWLKLLFENGVNGILADEMGLGKTIQVIALISFLIEKNVRGPFLIIGPLSTLPNWTLEFDRFAPQASILFAPDLFIPYLLYHGSEDKRAAVRSKMNRKTVIEGHKAYPVIITSYDYPLRDAKYLRKMNWRYIIIDEGHRIKNHNSQLSRALRTYQSANRLLLTGTPLHNSLSELWALLNFLVPEIFDDLEIFESWFRLEDLASEGGSEKVLEEEKKKSVLSTMHKILSPFMLRRVKSEVKLNLPPKKEIIVYAPMTPIQLELYRAVLDYNLNVLSAKKDEENIILEKRACTTTKKYYNLNELFRAEDELEAAGPAEDKKMLVVEDKENHKFAIRVKMQNTGMMLRKIVNHPYLVQYPLEPGTAYARIDEDLVKTSGKLLVLDAMLTRLKERGHKVLLFSTFTSLIDILEDYLSLRSYRYVRLDGSTKIEDRQIAIKEFNFDPDLFLFLISTRAGGLGINLASADTVILFDSDWNPQVDLQAQDRCHRIGQTRPVVVYRFVTAGTVDERIVVRAAAKRKLEKIIIHKGNYSALQKSEESAVDLEELRKLLQSRDHQRVIHPNGFVFSDEELEDLLDRSDLINGKAENSASDEKDLKERQFKEVYGYTGTKQVNSIDDKESNVHIVDEDSNDASCEVSSPLRRSTTKTSSFSGSFSKEEDNASQLNAGADKGLKRKLSSESNSKAERQKVACLEEDTSNSSDDSNSKANVRNADTHSRKTRSLRKKK
ncbi:Lymphoid-specific helicase, partial [Frankliniella fusca]